MGKNTFKMAEKGFNQNSTENNIYKKANNADNIKNSFSYVQCQM